MLVPFVVGCCRFWLLLMLIDCLSLQILFGVSVGLYQCRSFLSVSCLLSLTVRVNVLLVICVGDGIDVIVLSQK